MPRTADPFDELAALFLTDPDRPDGDRAQRATVELLIVGHLPVRGSLWLVPYADAVAREAGPTALIRLDDEQPSLEILRGPPGAPPPSAAGTLREAIAEVAAVPASWMVRPAGGTTSGEIVAAGAERITILTSADQAAVVRAYEWVLNLVEAAERSHRPAPQIGLAVLGADTEVARGVMGRINQTARANLDIELPLVVCVPRMDAEVKSSGSLRFSAQTTCDLAEVVNWINTPGPTPAPGVASPEREQVPSTGSGSRPLRPAVTAARPYQREPGGALEQGARSAAADDASAHQSERRPGGPYGALETTQTVPSAARSDAPEPAAAPAPPVPTAVCESCGSTVKLVPKPSVELETKAPAGSIEPDDRGAPVPLAHHVEGLTPLAVRCPGHERVELALDTAGRLNILGREDAMRQMRIVETWAKAHREIISMACPDQWIDPGGATVTHVFTERPASVADLHGSDLRLHVLTPVTVEGRKGWYAAPLNAVVR